jgi:plastocyanin
MRSAAIIAAIALGLCGSASAATKPQAAGRVQRVDVVLSAFAFTPQSLRLHRGQTYQLRFVNRGSGGHNFAAPEFFASAQINPAEAGAVAGGKVEPGKGESRTVRLVPIAGTYWVTCTHFLHTGFGMIGSIVVD